MQCHKCNAEIPDSAILCEACGAVVETTPNNGHDNKKHRRINLIRWIAVCAAALVTLVGIVGMVANNSATMVAQRYVKESMEGDFKAVMSLCVGNKRSMLEQQSSEEQREAIFRNAEEQAATLGLELSINSFSEYYKAIETIVKETYTQAYGEGYKFSYKVRETEDMSVKEFDAICDAYENAYYNIGVDTDRLKIGKIVTVTVTVDGKDGAHSYDRTVYMVKYNGAWKAVSEAEAILPSN